MGSCTRQLSRTFDFHTLYNVAGRKNERNDFRSRVPTVMFQTRHHHLQHPHALKTGGIRHREPRRP